LEKEFYVIAFESTHYAIMVEKKLKDNYNIQTIPTPREITASCGLSIKFQGESLDGIIEELISQEINRDMLNVYRIERTANHKKAEKINWG
jgi:hypothetical protein